MGKPKKSTRVGLGQGSSPRGKITSQQDASKEDLSRKVEPVTDTVVQVVNRRIRAAKKKMQKVTMIESLREQGQDLQEDQDRIYMTKGPLTAVIEELTKLEPLIEAALANELAEYKKKFQEEFVQETEKEAGPSQPLTDSIQSEVTDEEASQQEIPSLPEDLEDTKPSQEASPVEGTTPGLTSVDISNLHVVMEVLYVAQLFGKEQFDVTAVIEGDSEEVQEGWISVEESKLLVEFGKKVFPSIPHVLKDGMESMKELVLDLISKNTIEIQKICEIVEKLKLTEFYSQELKLALQEFPVAVEVEVSETTTEEATEKPEEKTKQQQEEEGSEFIAQATQTTPSVVDSPMTLTPGLTSVPMVQYSLSPGTENLPAKASRPFLPFPGVSMTSSAPVGLVMTQSPHMVGVHPYFSVPSMPGAYIQAPPPPYYPSPPPVNTPPPAAQPPSPDATATTEEAPVVESEESEEAPEVEKIEMSEKVCEEKTSEHIVRDRWSEKESKESAPLPQHVPGPRPTFTPTASSGRRGVNPPSHGQRTPWRGRFGRGREGGPRGRNFQGPMPGRRPVYEAQRPHRPPFMQPRDPAGGGRSSYDPRPRYRRNP